MVSFADEVETGLLALFVVVVEFKFVLLLLLFTCWIVDILSSFLILLTSLKLESIELAGTVLPAVFEAAAASDIDDWCFILGCWIAIADFGGGDVDFGGSNDVGVGAGVGVVVVDVVVVVISLNVVQQPAIETIGVSGMIRRAAASETAADKDWVVLDDVLALLWFADEDDNDDDSKCDEDLLRVSLFIFSINFWSNPSCQNSTPMPLKGNFCITAM